MADAVVMLEVPFAQKNEAKALGARWDPEAVSWYVPAGRDPAPFQRWVPRQVRTGGSTIPARLLGQAQWCYRCNGRGVALTGILVAPRYSLDPCGFIGFDFVARALGTLVNGTPLAERYSIGRIRMRSSQAHPGGYVANACRYCDALWGSFPLQEGGTEYLADGGSYDRLVIGELAFPVSELPDLRSAWDDWDDEEEWDDEDDDEDEPLAPLTAASAARPVVVGHERSCGSQAPAAEPPTSAACAQASSRRPDRGWRPWRR